MQSVKPFCFNLGAVPRKLHKARGLDSRVNLVPFSHECPVGLCFELGVAHLFWRRYVGLQCMYVFDDWLVYSSDHHHHNDDDDRATRYRPHTLTIHTRLCWLVAYSYVQVIYTRQIDFVTSLSFSRLSFFVCFSRIYCRHPLKRDYPPGQTPPL